MQNIEINQYEKSSLIVCVCFSTFFMFDTTFYCKMLSIFLPAFSISVSISHICIKVHKNTKKNTILFKPLGHVLSTILNMVKYVVAPGAVILGQDTHPRSISWCNCHVLGQGEEVAIHYLSLTDKAQGGESRWGHEGVSARKVPSPNGTNKSGSRSAPSQSLKREERGLNTSCRRQQSYL